MWFLDQIVSWLGSARDSLYSAYLEVRGWIWPFHHLSTPLYNIYTAFYYLTIYFSYFNDWVEDTATKLTTILSYANITSYFSYYFDAATNAWTWVVNAVSNVTSIINSWWSSAQYTVLAWIDNAKYWLQTQINSLNVWVSNLQASINELLALIPSMSEIIAWFSNWWSLILAQIISWGGLPAALIQDLINSTLRLWFPFYDELASLWNNIRDFFADPLGWIYNKLEEFFERFW